MKLYSFLLVISHLFVACTATVQDHFYEPVDELHAKLQVLPTNVIRYEKDGPYQVEVFQDQRITLTATETRNVDVYRVRALGLAPLVLMSHGNFSGKRAHADQARRLASWGFHVIVMELPNRNDWIENGRRVFELSSFLKRWPKYVGENVDPNRMILIGHSFGGSAATIAASQQAPVSGVILLDPAVVHPSVVVAMRKVTLPAVLLGADPGVFQARGRSQFRKNWGGEFLEMTVKGATHDDAQGPSMFSRFALGVDPFTDNKQREIFKSAIVSAAVSISMNGNLTKTRQEFSTKDAKQSVRLVNFRSNQR